MNQRIVFSLVAVGLLTLSAQGAAAAVLAPPTSSSTSSSTTTTSSPPPPPSPSEPVSELEKYFHDHARPTPSDLDDHPQRRAKFTLDQSWGLEGTTFRAISTSVPREASTLLWSLDAQPLVGTNAQFERIALASWGGVEGADVTFRIKEAGVHFLSLSATWTEANGTTTTDRVTSPIYVEEPAIELVRRYEAQSAYPNPANIQLPSLKGVLYDPLLTSANAKLPTVLLISDFLTDTASNRNRFPLALPPQNVDAALAALGPLDGLDRAAGFGAIYRDGSTALGAPLTHAGQALLESLVGGGLANVVFVSGLDARSGTLDRAAIRNGLLWAQHSGQVHAIVWGLPSSVYQPALLMNAMRPHVNYDQTQLFSVPAAESLPGATWNWRDSEYMPDDRRSIMELLFEQAFLSEDLQPDQKANQLGELLWRNRAQLPPHVRGLAGAFANDQRFDTFLADAVNRLGLKGIPVVAPSEDCSELVLDRYMSLIGISQLPGVVTVAPGTQTAGPDGYACKGPDRNAAAHGTGIDFFTDPDPLAVDKASLDRLGLSAVPYLDNSLGAAAKVGLALGWLSALQRSAQTPWTATDLVGILSTHAKLHPNIPAWRQGVGRIDTVSTGYLQALLALPSVFPRATSIVFSPWNPQTGEAVGLVQVVSTNAQATDALAAGNGTGWTIGSNRENQTQFRLYSNVSGALRYQMLRNDHPSRMHAELRSLAFERVSQQVGVATLALDAVPSHVDRREPGMVDPPSKWLLPGLYEGRTWISTPSNGILQLPINIGVGNILDVYRFLAPHTPVSDTAVCLALPFKEIRDMASLRALAFEMEMEEICIYWTNTDRNGVARFYSALPLPYTLVSFFSPHFEERLKQTTLVDGTVVGESARGRAPGYYPQIEESIVVESPINVTGVAAWAAHAPQGNWYEATITGTSNHPVYIDADLPYPLVSAFRNLTFPVAISINWVYRDNIEATHFLPIPSILSPEFLDVLSGVLPNPAQSLLGPAQQGVQVPDGLLMNAPEQFNAVLGSAQDSIKGQLPTNSTYVDALLAQPITKALPLNLQADPGACSWGYGHESAPIMTGIVDQLYDRSRRTGEDLQQIFQHLSAHRDDETVPDTLVMRMQPTLNYLLGLSTNIPACVAAYPINLPQPNYKSFFIHEFDLHLENAVMVVCLIVVQVECFILVPDVLGDALFIVPMESVMEDSAGVPSEAGRLMADAAAMGDPSQIGAFLHQRVGETENRTRNAANLSLPEKVGLTQDGHVNLLFEQPSYDRDNGVLIYVALPLDLGAGGFIDPLVGVLERSGLSPSQLLNLTLPETPMGLTNLTLNASKLLRDSVEDMLRSQAYIEVKRPVFHFDTWWWIDSFFDARISPTEILPRALRERLGTPDGPFELGEDFWWPTFPNINMEYFEYGMRFWDPHTLQPDLARMRAANYPWNQPEYFEAVLEFWDDEHVVDATPNQLHFHDASTAHDMVNFAQHCTDLVVRDPVTQVPLNDPSTGQYCYDGLLAYEEGDRWLKHADSYGNGIYDPDLGLFPVKIIDLGIVDSVFGLLDSTWQGVWSTQVGFPVLGGSPQTLAQAVDGLAGVNLQNLTWWKRDAGPTANRRVYADMHTNTSYFFSPLYKPCEEQYDLPGQVALLLDAHPRWKFDCAWQGGRVGDVWEWQRKEPDLSAPKAKAATPNGWFERDVVPPVGSPPAGPGLWHSRLGIQCERAPWESVDPNADASSRWQRILDFYAQRSIPLTAVLVWKDVASFPDVCGEYDGWQYWVKASAGFDGPAQPKSHYFSQILQPRFYNGTFGINYTAWGQCLASPSGTLGGWSCNGETPMDVIWRDLVDYVRQYVPAAVVSVPDPDSGALVAARVQPLELAMLVFGANDDETVTFTRVSDGARFPVPLLTNNGGGDALERFVTVPLPSNPDGWYGADPQATEWDAFYRSAVFREYHPWTAVLQQHVRGAAPLLRDWLEGDIAGIQSWFLSRGLVPPPWATRSQDNPFWDDVTGRDVPFQEWSRLRDTDDPDAPARVRLDGSLTGTRGCDGAYWWGQCHEREMSYDVGDLTGFGRAGFWGHETKKKVIFIPQGSTFARFNQEHRLPVPFLIASTFDAAQVHAHRAQVTDASCEARTDYWILAPLAVDLASDGWSASSAPADASPAPPDQRWWAMSVSDCTQQPWQAWQAETQYRPRGSMTPTAAGEVVGLAHVVSAYYYYGDRGICWFSPLTGHGANVHAAHEENRPFDVTFYDDPHHAGTYNHESRGGFEEPVPALPYGHWCPNVRNGTAPARSDREYIPLRLPRDIMGGDGSLRQLPPLMPYVPEGGNEFPFVKLALDVNDLGRTLMGTLNEVLGIVDGIAGEAFGVLGTGLNTLNETLAETPLATLTTPAGDPFVGGASVGDVVALAEDLLPDDGPNVVQVVRGASPVAPIVQVELDARLTAAELVVVHTFDFVGGVRGAFMVSEDAQNWSVLASRGAPAFTMRSQGSGGHLAFFDLTPYRGKTVMIGTQLLGTDWRMSDWTIHRLTVLPAGLDAAIAPPIAGWDQSTDGFVVLQSPTASSLQALDGQNVLLQGPLTIGANESVQLTGMTLVVDRCGATYCPIVVEGSLDLVDVTVAPLASAPLGSNGVDEGVPFIVKGVLNGTLLRLEGLLGGLKVIGGSVDLKDCWLVDTGHVGVLTILGRAHVRGCVFADQAVGVYALGSEVRLEGNLFYRMVRSAATLDESWGVVRGNHIVHTKQAGVYMRSPLGAGNLAVFDNWIEETGMGVGGSLVLEDRVLALNPLALSVPLEARHRFQANWFEWNNLEALEAGAVSAPVMYGNNVTHSNIGVRVGWLAPATARFNTLYSDRTQWSDPERRTQPPRDGNVWSGLWQLEGLKLDVDARDNYWGPGVVKVGDSRSVWPMDVVVADNVFGTTVRHEPSASEYQSRPLLVGVTAPGYGGGLLPILKTLRDGVLQPLLPQDVLSQLNTSIVGPTSIVDPSLMQELPLDLVTIDGYLNRSIRAHWDVAPGVQQVRLRGDYYSLLGLPVPQSLGDALELAEGLEELPITDPARILSPSVRRVEWRNISVPAGATHGVFEFQFDAWNESRVQWRVEAFQVDGQWYAGDGVVTKDAVVHNSIIWPLLTDLAFVVNDLVFGKLLPDWTLEETTIPASVLQVDPAKLQQQGLPLQMLADGALAVDGVPTALTLARDQDPILGYEMRYGVSTDPGRLLPLGQGFGRDRTWPVPNVGEGVTLELQARAMDASGLASPWTGVRLLKDSHAPTLDLSTTGLCLNVDLLGQRDGIDYAAHEWTDGSWSSGDGRRASGIGRLRLEALPQSGAPIVMEVARPDADSYVGTWRLPEAAYVEGEKYVVRGFVMDRAGHIAVDQTEQLTVDASVPFAAVPVSLTTVAEVLDLPPLLQGVLPVQEPFLLLEFAFADLGCGLDVIELKRLVDGVVESVRLLPPHARLFLDHNWSSIQGHTVSYELTGIDVTGKRSLTQSTHPQVVDFVRPVAGLHVPAEAGELAMQIGRTILDGVDLGVSPAGGTVLSPKPLAIPFVVGASHPDASVSVRTELWIDGQNRTDEVVDGGFVWDTRRVSNNEAHQVVVRSYGSNGLMGSERLVFYFPFEPSAFPLEESESRWLLTASSGAVAERVVNQGTFKIHLSSGAAGSARAQYEQVLVSDALSVESVVTLGSTPSAGSVGILRLMEGSAVRAEVYTPVNSRELVLRGPAGPVTSTGFVLNVNQAYTVRLAVTPTSASLLVNNVVRATQSFAPHGWSLTGLEVSAENRDAWWDAFIVRSMHVGVQGADAADNAARWIGFVPSGTTTSTHLAQVEGTTDKLLHVKSTDDRVARLSWSNEVPSAVTVFETTVRYSYRHSSCTNARLGLLEVMDGDVVRAALSLRGCGTTLQVERAGLPTVGTSTYIYQYQYYKIRAVLTTSGLDVWVNDLLVGSYDLAMAQASQSLRFSALRFEATWNPTTVRTMGYGFYKALQDPITSFAGWSPSGNGAVSTASTGMGMALRVDGVDNSYRVLSPVLGLGRVGHVGAYFRLEEAAVGDVQVLGLVTPASQRILSVVVRGSDLLASDGASGWIVLPVSVVPGQWHRLDVDVWGSTYAVVVDGMDSERVVSRTAATGQISRFSLGQSPTAFLFDRWVAVNGDGLYVDNLFEEGVYAEAGWAAAEGPGGSVQHTASGGVVGPKAVRIAGSAVKNSRSFVYAPTAYVGSYGTYEVAWRIEPGVTANHVSVAAGLTSVGGGLWSVHLVPVGVLDVTQPVRDYLLVYRDLTKVGSDQVLGTQTYAAGVWHSVRLDFSGTSLAIVVNEALVKSVALPAVTPVIAYGDVMADDLGLTGSGVVWFDDARVVRRI